VTITHGTREVAPPSHATEAIIVTFGTVAVVAACWVVSRYRRWAAEISPFAGPRAKAAALKTNYRQKRSDVADVTGAVGALLKAIDRARSHA
jgi:hypothetical protein